MSGSTHSGGFSFPGGRGSPQVSSMDDQLIALLRRYVFETSHPELRSWLSRPLNGYRALSYADLPFGCCPKHHYALDTARPRNCADSCFLSLSNWQMWTPADLHRLRWHYRRPAPLQDERILSQGTILQDPRPALGSYYWSPGPWGLPPVVPEVTSGAYTVRDSYKLGDALLPIEPGSRSGRRQRRITAPHHSYSATLRSRRSRSEPPPGSYMLTAVPDPYQPAEEGIGALSARLHQPTLEICLRRRRHPPDVYTPLYVPCPRVSEVDHRLRRRSLSRRHVARMFHVPSREGGFFEKSESAKLDRRLKEMEKRCGWCGSGRHRDNKCPVSKRNRCKCRPWPIYHTAKECPIECSRLCMDAETKRRKGHGWPAMICKARCCMCGWRGHSGRDCEQKRCRCGGIHLGQDCGWKPGCVAKGCDRFLCPVHCQECGSAEKPFVARRCKACLGNGVPAGEGAYERGESKRTRYRKGKRMRETKERGEAECGKAVKDLKA